MEMMFAINKENFEGHREVTCYSCHRGSTDPVGTPPVMAEEPKPAWAKRRTAEETQGEVAERNERAAGRSVARQISAGCGRSRCRSKRLRAG